MKILRTRARRVMADTDVAPEASELLFESEDVAGLLADATGEDVDVSVSGDSVEFTVGEEVFIASPEENTEVVESRTMIPRTRRTVSASTRRSASAGRGITNSTGRTVRRVPRRK